MKTVELIAPCHFGLEAVLKREILDLGYEIVKVEDGRITFRTDLDGIARANIFLRTAERILLKIGSFKAYTFDDLFEGTKKLPWEDYIPENGRFWVKKASTAKSKLFSAPDIQSIVKKAMVDRMKSKYKVSWFNEDGDDYPVRVFILKDQVTISLDTTGIPLHKRGYRKLVSEAPIRETLAAALLMLTPWHKDRILVDPFCGSGTFLIEAAMMGMNMAPGMNRSFESEEVKDLRHPKPYGFIIANPPYGERLEDQETLPQLYTEMKEAFDRLDTWSKYVITSYEDTEKYLGKPTKKRKVYNGMIRGEFYQYLGPKPPRRRK